MYLKEVADKWEYPLAELLNYLDLSFEDYQRLIAINAPLDRRTINFVKAIKLLYANDKRVRYIRIVKDHQRHIMPIDKAIIRGCAVCNKGISDPRAIYCSNACKQKAYRQRQSLKMPASQKMLPFRVTV